MILVYYPSTTLLSYCPIWRIKFSFYPVWYQSTILLSHMEDKIFFLPYMILVYTTSQSYMVLVYYPSTTLLSYDPIWRIKFSFYPIWYQSTLPCYLMILYRRKIFFLPYMVLVYTTLLPYMVLVYYYLAIVYRRKIFFLPYMVLVYYYLAIVYRRKIFLLPYMVLVYYLTVLYGG